MFRLLKINSLLIISVLALLATVPLLGGCASLAEGDQRSELIATVAIKVATSKVISRSDDPPAKAHRIVDIATTAKQIASEGTVALVADLHDEINIRIDWAALDPGDTVLAQALIETVRSELEARLDNNLLNEGSLIVLHLVLDNIIEAATVYITPD